MREFRCPECGHGTVRPARVSGRHWPFRTIRNLILPDEVEIPTCSSCGEYWVDEETADKIQAALEPVYQAELTKRAGAAIDVLRASHAQRALERVIGVSAGYLSKLRSGKESSPSLVALLMLLAASPERVEELRGLWSGPSEGAQQGQSVPSNLITNVPFGRQRVVENSGRGARPLTVAQEPARTMSPPITVGHGLKATSLDDMMAASR